MSELLKILGILSLIENIFIGKEGFLNDFKKGLYIRDFRRNVK
jgi:hypothetical protein